MRDYLLRFASKAIAEQFGIANGFAAVDENGEVQSSLASHTHALCIIGEHNGGDEDTPATGDGQYWVLFRDLVGIPIPEGADQFIFWASDFTVDDEEGNPVPVLRPISEDVPSLFWA
jgi:hypothetical protein